MTVGRNAAGTIFNIQVVRFIAAAMVMYSHLEHELVDRTWLSNVPYTPFEPVYWAGGVDIFFVVSGFIMYYISNDKFGKPGAWSDFLVRRLIRIAPPYWLFTGLMAVMCVVFTKYIDHSALIFYHVLASFLFIPAQNAYGGGYPLLIAGWTLNYEMLFYVLFCVGLAFRRRLGLPLIFAALIGLAALNLAHPRWFPLQFWSNPIVLEFCFGIALARLRLAGAHWSPVTGLAISASGFLLMAVLQADHIAHHYWSFRWLWMGVPAALVCAGLFCARESEKPGRLKRLLVFGGDSSYALYLSHPFTLNLIALLFRQMGGVNPNLYLVLAFSSSLFVAALIYKYVERPIYERLNAAHRHLINRRRPASAVAV